MVALTEITVERLADLIIAEWSDKQSDSGAIWRKSWEALELAKKDCGDELLHEAHRIATARYQAMSNNVEA